MHSIKDYQKAIKCLSNFRVVSGDCTDMHLALVSKILNSVQDVYAKNGLNLTPEDHLRLKFFGELYPDVKKSLDSISKYNKSLTEDYSEGMTLVSKLLGKSKDGN